MAGESSFCCPGCREVFQPFGEVIPDNRSNGDTGQKPAAPTGAVAYLRIDGMHCSSCEILIDRMADRFGPLLSVRPNQTTAAARVVCDPDNVPGDDLPRRQGRSGYRVSPGSQARAASDGNRALFRVVVAITPGRWW
jgi:Cu2+-exporting ATPase